VECTPDAVFFNRPGSRHGPVARAIPKHDLVDGNQDGKNVDAFITTRRWQRMTQPEVFARDTPSTLVLGRSAFRIRRRFVSSKSERHAAENKYIAIAPLVGSGKILPAAQVAEERERTTTTTQDQMKSNVST
jgi:hypothetical protein